MSDACHEVPQATKMMRRALRNRSRLSMMPDRITSYVSGVDPAPNAVHDGLGLLEDLLEHEVRIAAFSSWEMLSCNFLMSILLSWLSSVTIFSGWLRSMTTTSPSLT